MKKWYTSKTILLAIVQAAGGIFLALTSEYPDVGFLFMAKSVIDFIMRYFTSEEIG